MRRGVLLFLFLLGTLIVQVNAEVQTLGTFSLNSEIELIQICDNCTYVNITSILYPNSTQCIGQVSMTKEGTYYNYTTSCSSVIGKYIVNGFGDDSGSNTVWSYDYYVNPSGNTLGIAEGIIYIIFLSVLILTFLLFLWGSFVIPYGNQRGDDGVIVSINDLKYFKVTCIVFSYLLLMSIFGVMRQISANYLFLGGVHKIFQWLFWFMLSFTFPTIVVSLILSLVLFFEDKKIKKILERGVPFR